jgi:hypothetical protein
MPEYLRGKIYKLQCDDGYYYIGSTCNDLRKRLWTHKADYNRNRQISCYNHIRDIGGWDRVRIVLIEDYPCENKEQLVRKEDTLIRTNQNDTFCLNHNGSFTASSEVRTEQNRAKCNRFYQKNKDEINRKTREKYYSSSHQALSSK